MSTTLHAATQLDLSLAINEIFLSLQGESSYAGRPCTFIRLKGCPLRCRWCDSEYAFYEGEQKTFSEILAQLRDLSCQLVEVTGGEPLAQRNCIPFLQTLCDSGFEVMLETSGALDVSAVPKAVKIIMDLKAPGSQESSKNLWENIVHLKPGFDEIKIVVGDDKDFEFAIKACADHKLFEKFTVLLSSVDGELENAKLADWILESRLPFRFQHQLHKFIWPKKSRAF
ncbi:MAG: radical SAM protein [Bdellovibrionota bacterium]